jgi:hypothetical protein
MLTIFWLAVGYIINHQKTPQKSKDVCYTAAKAQNLAIIHSANKRHKVH